MRKLILLLTFIILSFSLCAETLAQQSFEGLATDTWAYTSNPAPNRMIYWGPTSEAMGGASAQEGAVYWAGWDLDNQDCTLTFPALSLPLGFTYNLTFWYYTKNLDPVSDFCRYSLKYDNGSTWDNWVTVNNNSNAWTSVSVELPAGSPYLRLRLSSSFDGITKYAHWDHVTVEKTTTPSAAPIVSNLTVSQRTDGSKLVDIYYDLFDANYDLCEVSFKVSTDNGVNYNVLPTAAYVSGDFGANISSGIGKHIIWDAGAESFGLDGSYLYRVSADDGSGPPIPGNFVFVPGGTIYPPNGIYTGGLTVSSFYMDKYELTQAGYQAVMGSNPAYGCGVGTNYPVYRVSWFNAIEYSNRRSMQEGLTPCYSYSTYGTNPNNWPGGWNSDYNNDVNVSCSWTANGYRLPSEAEWEYAARGGLQTHGYTYSGSNDLNAVGWYWDNWGVSSNSTHTVGALAANELGIYDLSGNVWEWCWDMEEISSTRVFRGGSWDYNANSCTVSARASYLATYVPNFIGFRLCRSLDNFVLVEGGTFNNGTSDVTVSSFYMDKYELTQAGYQAVMGNNPASGYGVGATYPVYNVSWFNAIEYANRRSLQEGLTPCYSYSINGTNPDNWPAGWDTDYHNHVNVSCNWSANGYRLPTEMEWQFAAQGGNQTHNYTYSGSNNINAVAWYDENSGDNIHTIGTLAANELGTFDMSGNVFEWVWDMYNSYPNGAQINPHGATDSSFRLLRGGGWDTYYSFSTVSNRYAAVATLAYSSFGFRLCRISP